MLSMKKTDNIKLLELLFKLCDIIEKQYDTFTMVLTSWYFLSIGKYIIIPLHTKR
jgi:hypothetical protein